MSEPNDHIVIIFAPNNFNTLGVVRSLGEVGIRSCCVLICERRSLVCFSKYVERSYLAESLKDGLSYILRTFGEETKKPFIIATSDETVSFLDLHYDELKDKFFFFNAGEQGRITRMMEKSYLPKLAESCGLRVPKTEEVKKGDLPKSLKYPVITKSPTSTIYNWKSNVHICYNEDELLKAFKLINQDRVVIQEYIEKIDEIDYEGFVINDGQDLYMPLDNRYYRTEKDGYGHYAYIERNFFPELFEPIKRLFERTKFNGIFELEFLIDKEGHAYFLEINFRGSAWLYAFNKCGVNLPYMFVRSTLQGRVDSSCEDIKKLPFSFMYTITDFKLNVLKRKVTLWRWLCEFLRADCYFYYSRHDIKPFLDKIWNYLKF